MREARASGRVSHQHFHWSYASLAAARSFHCLRLRWAISYGSKAIGTNSTSTTYSSLVLFSLENPEVSLLEDDGESGHHAERQDSCSMGLILSIKPHIRPERSPWWLRPTPTDTDRLKDPLGTEHGMSVEMTVARPTGDIDRQRKFSIRTCLR